MDIPLSYNAILGQSILNGNNILINIDCLCLKLLDLGGISVVKKSQKSAQECYSRFINTADKVTLPIDLLSGAFLELANYIEEVELYIGKKIKIGTALQGSNRKGLINTLAKRSSTFAWSSEEVPGVNPTSMVHSLNVDLNIKPIQQKKRKNVVNR